MSEKVELHCPHCGSILGERMPSGRFRALHKKRLFEQVSGEMRTSCPGYSKLTGEHCARTVTIVIQNGQPKIVGYVTV